MESWRNANVWHCFWTAERLQNQRKQYEHLRESQSNAAAERQTISRRHRPALAHEALNLDFNSHPGPRNPRYAQSICFAADLLAKGSCWTGSGRLHPAHHQNRPGPLEQHGETQFTSGQQLCFRLLLPSPFSGYDSDAPRYKDTRFWSGATL